MSKWANECECECVCVCVCVCEREREREREREKEKKSLFNFKRPAATYWLLLCACLHFSLEERVQGKK